ncbi:hypothetical protein FACS1894151_03690 [Spirochaetia bacterium]|nr:hypothetical protein FACS1894151_03690 [Spirochaetia bacterium]
MRGKMLLCLTVLLFSGLRCIPVQAAENSSTGLNGEERAISGVIWDVSAPLTSAVLSVSVPGMKENTCTLDRAVKEPWIPNTGEYLVLEEVQFLLESGGISVNDEICDKNSLEVIITGAYDYAYDVSKADEGNIYNNHTSSSFELALIKGSVIHRLGVLNKDDENASHYKVMYNEANVLYDTAGQNNWKNAEGFKVNRMKIDASGKLEIVLNGEAGYRIGIRPNGGPGGARPGDDIVLEFGIRRQDGEELTTGSGTTELLRGKMQDSDRIIVYDKKMLWRANLYLNEGRYTNSAFVKSRTDWNDTHPWNAPASGTSNNAAVNAWWSTAWGHNQWNLIYRRADAGFEMVFSGGDGKQGINFSAFPWAAVKTDNAAKTYIYEHAVAYDYPDDPVKDHPEQGVKAWDSPFDYIWKLNEQRKAVRRYFDSITSGENYRLLIDVAEFPTGLTVEPVKIEVTADNPLTNSAMHDWSKTTPAYNKWIFYWKKPEADSGNKKVKAYVPGIGLRKNQTTTTYVAGSAIGTDIDFEEQNSAGVDCVGFAYRAASYIGGENYYAWISARKRIMDRAENKDNINYNSDDYGRALRYPYPSDSSSTEIIRRDNTSKDYYTTNAGDIYGPSTAEFDIIREKFSRIIPGDTIQYCLINNDNTPRWNSGAHIGIIQYVDYNAIETARSIRELMAAVNVIESMYSGSISNIVIRSMTGDGKTTQLEEISNGSWHLDSSSKLRYWQIVRLRTI